MMKKDEEKGKVMDPVKGTFILEVGISELNGLLTSIGKGWTGDKI